MRKTAYSFISLFLCCGALNAAGISYSVVFEGVDDAKTLKALKSASQLSLLKKRPPASINALKYRAESDMPTLLKVLEAHGYYEAQVKTEILQGSNSLRVIVLVDPGPRYHIESYSIDLYCETPEEKNTCCVIPLEEIGIRLDSPARAQKILEAELKALTILSGCGYPLASIEEREIVVDGKTHGMRVSLKIKTGEKASFGATTIVGNQRVKPLFIERKIDWEEGETYNQSEVETTQNSLINTGLFSSVLITHEDTLSSTGRIPLKIEVAETKHRRLNLGVSYQTVFGPGLTFGWENRNVGGMGCKLSFQGDVTRISQTGIASYVHPDFRRVGQDLIGQAQAMHESLYAYSMRSYNILGRLERQFGPYIRLSGGVEGERLLVTESVQNGNFWLIEVPLNLRWSNANDLLNPTEGALLEYVAVPTGDVAYANDFAKDLYVLQTLSESTYHSIDKRGKIVFAQKLTLGSTWSSRLEAVPLSKRFFGGTESDLRGYRYRTVSPLVRGKPIGGRSAIFFTFETRFRITKTIGLVPFSRRWKRVDRKLPYF